MQSRENSIKREISELKKGLAILKLQYDEVIIQKFERYINVLYEYENNVHLLSHQDYERISKRHFLISLLSLPYLAGHHEACDIGAGAGFPSVPIAIFRPEINFTLFESIAKKARFLETLPTALGLTNIQIINDRAENYKLKKFDLMLIKAAGKIKSLIRLIDQIIVPNGCAIFYKSQGIEDEITRAQAEIEKRNFALRLEKVTAPLEDLSLTLVILTKRPIPDTNH